MSEQKCSKCGRDRGHAPDPCQICTLTDPANQNPFIKRIEQLEKQHAVLVGALKECHEALDSLPPDCLGIVPETDFCTGWYIRDELIYRVNKALKAAGSDE